MKRRKWLLPIMVLLKGDPERNYLYWSWEWEGDMYVRKEIAEEEK